MAVSRLIRIAYALQTYSGLLLLMLGFAAQCAIAAGPRALTEAVLEVTLSDTQPGEMMVVLRDAGTRTRKDDGREAR